MSLHDPDARPIAKGWLGRPIEFGYKAQVEDNADGLYPWIVRSTGVVNQFYCYCVDGDFGPRRRRFVHVPMPPAVSRRDNVDPLGDPWLVGA